MVFHMTTALATLIAAAATAIAPMLSPAAPAPTVSDLHCGTVSVVSPTLTRCAYTGGNLVEVVTYATDADADRAEAEPRSQRLAGNIVAHAATDEAFAVEMAHLYRIGLATNRVLSRQTCRAEHGNCFVVFT
jgi:hypothetical protein